MSQSESDDPVGYTVYTAMIKKKGNDSSRRRKTGASEVKQLGLPNYDCGASYQKKSNIIKKCQ